MTRRHPDDALVSNPDDTAVPRPRPGQQSQGHGATQTTPWSAIPKTRRHPDHALLTNPNDTAPPRRRPGQQPLRHGAAQSTPCSPNPMTRRHPDHALVSNPRCQLRTQAAPSSGTLARVLHELGRASSAVHCTGGMQGGPARPRRREEPGPAPNAKNDDSARPLKMSRFDPPEPGLAPNAKNDDSVQARPLKMSRFVSPERRLPPVLAALRGPAQQS